MCIVSCLRVCMCRQNVCISQGGADPLKWSWRWLYVTKCVLGTEAGSSGRAVMLLTTEPPSSPWFKLFIFLWGFKTTIHSFYVVTFKNSFQSISLYYRGVNVFTSIWKLQSKTFSDIFMCIHSLVFGKPEIPSYHKHIPVSLHIYFCTNFCHLKQGLSKELKNQICPVT